MALKHLGVNKKAAFVSLMIEIVNADGHIDISEILAINEICERERIGSQAFAFGKEFDLELALKTLKRCPPAVKCEIAAWLIYIAEADGCVQAPERIVLHMMFDQLDVLSALPEQ